MTATSLNARWRAGLLAIGLSYLGSAGCVFVAAFEAPRAELVPGTYFVEQRADKLYALSLGRTPSDLATTPDWLSVDMSEWFDGPGVYELSADMQWRRLQPSAGATLDDVIQLNDAPPAPPQ